MPLRIGFLRLLALVVFMSLSLGGVGLAQFVDCNRLSMQLAAPNRDVPSRRAMESAHKQADELARAQEYARSIGCDRTQFLFFGSAPPPQCPGLKAQIAKMSAKLSRLEGGGQGSDERRDLQRTFDAHCHSAAQDGPVEERVYDPLDKDSETLEPEGSPDGMPRAGPWAVCVRACDGAFFPISYSARSENLSGLQDRCKALCPNAEVMVYTRPARGGMAHALSMDGEAYTVHPNAFKYEKTTSAACRCKRADQNWSEVLRPAEDYLGDQRRDGDLIVTRAKAEELSRPGAQLKPGKTAGAQNNKISQAKPQNLDDQAGSPKFDPEAARKILEDRRRRDRADAPPPALPEDELLPSFDERGGRLSNPEIGPEFAPEIGPPRPVKPRRSSSAPRF